MTPWRRQSWRNAWLEAAGQIARARDLTREFLRDLCAAVASGAVLIACVVLAWYLFFLCLGALVGLAWRATRLGWAVAL